jgi:hypothetical protein
MGSADVWLFAQSNSAQAQMATQLVSAVKFTPHSSMRQNTRIEVSAIEPQMRSVGYGQANVPAVVPEGPTAFGTLKTVAK